MEGLGQLRFFFGTFYFLGFFTFTSTTITFVDFHISKLEFWTSEKWTNSTKWFFQHQKIKFSKKIKFLKNQIWIAEGNFATWALDLLKCVSAKWYRSTSSFAWELLYFWQQVRRPWVPTPTTDPTIKLADSWPWPFVFSGRVLPWQSTSALWYLTVVDERRQTIKKWKVDSFQLKSNHGIEENNFVQLPKCLFKKSCL